MQRIVEIYRRNGRFDVRVEPKIIELPNNRVDLVFEIKEGEKTGVKKIIFVGNKAYRRPAAEGRNQDLGNDPGSVLRSCSRPTSTIPTASKPTAT